jgi:hypothetical protein
MSGGREALATRPNALQQLGVSRALGNAKVGDMSGGTVSAKSVTLRGTEKSLLKIATATSAKSN